MAVLDEPDRLVDGVIPTFDPQRTIADFPQPNLSEESLNPDSVTPLRAGIGLRPNRTEEPLTPPKSDLSEEPLTQPGAETLDPSVATPPHRHRLPDVVSIVSFDPNTMSPSLSTSFEQARSGLETMPRRLGRYQIIRILGRGGMGSVDLAQDVELRRNVALKVMGDIGRTESSSVARFRREVRAAARLIHPGIVPIHDIGEQDGVVYMALEYVGGGTLADRIREAEMSPRSAARLALGLAEAVQAAHGQGVIHRDLKPSNILITEDGRPMISDFGLAR